MLDLVLSESIKMKDLSWTSLEPPIVTRTNKPKLLHVPILNSLLLYWHDIPLTSENEPKKKPMFKAGNAANNITLPSEKLYLYSFANNSWEVKEATGKVPTRRTSFKMVYLPNGTILLYGGTLLKSQETTIPAKLETDTYALNLSNLTWKKLFILETPSAAGECISLENLEENYILMVGSSQIWLLTVKEVKWELSTNDLPGAVWTQIQLSTPIQNIRAVTPFNESSLLYLNTEGCLNRLVLSKKYESASFIKLESSELIISDPIIIFAKYSLSKNDYVLLTSTKSFKVNINEAKNEASITILAEYLQITSEAFQIIEGRELYNISQSNKFERAYLPDAEIETALIEENNSQQEEYEINAAQSMQVSEVEVEIPEAEFSENPSATFNELEAKSILFQPSENNSLVQPQNQYKSLTSPEQEYKSLGYHQKASPIQNNMLHIPPNNSKFEVSAEGFALKLGSQQEQLTSGNSTLYPKLLKLLAFEYLRRCILQRKSKILENSIRSTESMVLAVYSYGSEIEKLEHINEVRRIQKELKIVYGRESYYKKEMGDGQLVESLLKQEIYKIIRKGGPNAKLFQNYCQF